MNKTTFFTKNSLLTFVLLTFAYSILGFLLSFALTSLFGQPQGILKMYVPNVFVACAPGLAALTVVYKDSGRKGINKLLTSLVPTKRLFPYLVLFPVVALALSFCIFHFAGIPTDTLTAMIAENWELLLLHFFFHILVIGIGEEVGWRGWMLPKLLSKKSLAVATFLVFLVWAPWHLPKLLISVEVSVPFVLINFSMSVLLSWFWIKSGRNLFLAAVIHGSFNTPVFFMEQQFNAYNIPWEQVLTGWQLHAVVYFAIAAIMVFLNWKRWWQKEDLLQTNEKKIFETHSLKV